MAISFLSTATASSSLLPIRRFSHQKPTTAPSLSLPLKPHRSPSCSILPPEAPRFSTSSKTPTPNLLSSLTSTSRTLLFLLVASLLSLSGVGPLPSLAASPPPTQQPQETKEEQDWDGVLRYARRLREAEPGEVEWWLMEALLHELKGDLAEAERLFTEVLAEKPLLVRALHARDVFVAKEAVLQKKISQEMERAKEPGWKCPVAH